MHGESCVRPRYGSHHPHPHLIHIHHPLPNTAATYPYTTYPSYLLSTPYNAGPDSRTSILVIVRAAERVYAALRLSQVLRRCDGTLLDSPTPYNAGSDSGTSILVIVREAARVYAAPRLSQVLRRCDGTLWYARLFTDGSFSVLVQLSTPPSLVYSTLLDCSTLLVYSTRIRGNPLPHPSSRLEPTPYSSVHLSHSTHPTLLHSPPSLPQSLTRRLHPLSQPYLPTSLTRSSSPSRTPYPPPNLLQSFTRRLPYLPAHPPSPYPTPHTTLPTLYPLRAFKCADRLFSRTDYIRA